MKNNLQRFLFVLTAAALLQACSASGLLPVGDGDGGASTIPRVIANCQTSACRSNASAPLISAAITTSSCSNNDALFGAVVTSSTRGTACSSTSGCYVSFQNWTSSSGTAVSLPAGTYNICSCIKFSGAGNPWDSCDITGAINNVQVSNGSGLQMISTWF